MHLLQLPGTPLTNPLMKTLLTNGTKIMSKAFFLDLDYSHSLRSARTNYSTRTQRESLPPASPPATLQVQKNVHAWPIFRARGDWHASTPTATARVASIASQASCAESPTQTGPESQAVPDMWSERFRRQRCFVSSIPAPIRDGRPFELGGWRIRLSSLSFRTPLLRSKAPRWRGGTAIRPQSTE